MACYRMQPMVVGLVAVCTSNHCIGTGQVISSAACHEAVSDRVAGRAAQPFSNAQEAWLWTMAALAARREGARYSAGKGRVARPCEPDDVVRCLDALYRQRRIDLAHAQILRLWGDRQMAPSPAIVAERGDY